MKKIKPVHILVVALLVLIIILLGIYGKSILDQPIDQPIDLGDSISPECIKEWTKAKDYCMQLYAISSQ